MVIIYFTYKSINYTLSPIISLHKLIVDALCIDLLSSGKSLPYGLAIIIVSVIFQTPSAF